jgi:hypothetical protein
MCKFSFGLGKAVYGRLLLVIGFLMLGQALGPPALAQATNCHVPPPTFWLTNVIRQVVTANFPDSFMLTEIRDMPRGYTVSNGVYVGWCVDYKGLITPGNINQAEMYYSYGDLPPYLQHPNWDLVNYLINHKQGNSVDVQYAIWYFIGGPVAPEDHAFYPPKAPALAMIIDATLHGEGFVPAPGQVSAVILVPEEQRQINIIEVACPLPPVCIYNDYAYHDLNGNGVRDGNEPALTNSPLALTDCDGNILGFTETDSSGYFTIDITNAVPASFRLALLDPPLDYPVVRATPGYFNENAMTRCFVLSNDCLVVPPPPPRTAVLGDLVWEDLNANGIQDASEPGVSGVTVRLLDCDGNVLDTTATDNRGAYRFANLLAGNYRIGFVAPAGFGFTRQDESFDHLDSDANLSSGLTPCLILHVGETNLTVDAGLVRLGRIGNFVWHDLNHNGVQDANEPGLGNVRVALADCSGNLLRLTTTDANGLYLFDDLRAGSYRVTFAPPNGFSFTMANQGDASLDSDADPNSGMAACVTLAAGQSELNVDAGLFQMATAGAFVWQELNLDGVYQPNEPGIGSIGALLCDASGHTVATSTTDANGYCWFDHLMPGQYILTLTTPPGCVFAGLNLESGLNSGPEQVSSTLAVTSGEVKLTAAAGVIVPGSIGDLVWIDLNQNGRQDGDEPGLAGITVDLLDCGGRRITSTLSDSQGHYRFSGLAPGNYQIHVVAPANYVFTTQNAGDDTRDSDVDVATGKTTCFTLGSGQTITQVDAGLVPLGGIGDRVWHDLNSNGLQDGDEPGLSGVLVRLYDCAGHIIAATNTSANGSYLFSGLIPGSYKVTFVAPAGYIFTRKVAGNTETDSDANPANGTTDCLTLNPGETQRHIDAGLKRTLQYVTGTPADWGATARPNNAAALLFRRWGSIYRKGLIVGGTYKIKLTSQRATDEFLPASGAPAPLRKHYGNPLTTEAGAFAGEVVALKINLDFSGAKILPPGLTKLKIAPGNKLAGRNVGEILTLANQVLGGRLVALPAGCSLEDLYNVVASINANFANGGDLGFLVQ